MARAPKRRVARARGEAEARIKVERRTGTIDRRAMARAVLDRRVGPRTAARMAKVRIEGDVDFLKKSVTDGDWREVARVAAGIAGEVGSFLYSGVRWPLAFLGSDLPTKVADADKDAPADARRPVILLHGWFHNRTGLTLLAKRLRKAGRQHVFALDLPTATASVQRMSEILDEKVAKLCELTGSSHVDVVAHSLGGLVAHWWMQHGGGAKRLKNLVTLGAPHKGTALAAFLPMGTARAINIGSEVVRSLDVAPPPGVRLTSIWSDMDYLILPPEVAVDDPGTIRVRYVGHLSLLYSKAVFVEVERSLRTEAPVRRSRRKS